MNPSKKIFMSCSARTKLKINSPSQTTIWDTFLRHLRHISKWNQSNQSSDEGVIHFTNEVNSRPRDLDLRAFNGGVRPSQKESNDELNFSGILIHPRIFESWNHIKISSYLRDMDFPSRWNCLSPTFAYDPKERVIQTNSATISTRNHLENVNGYLIFPEIPRTEDFPIGTQGDAPFSKGVQSASLFEDFQAQLA